MTGPRWLPAAAITLFAAGMAWLNRGERVALDVGIATFYRAPLTVVLFLAFLAGMLSMLWLSLRQDRRIRDELRARGILDFPAQPAAPAAPAAPAWTQPEEPVVRADAPPAEERTAAHPGSHDGLAARVDMPPGEDRTAARPDSYDGLARVDVPPAGDRTVAYPRPSEDAAARVEMPPAAEDRTVAYPRLDEDPAA